MDDRLALSVTHPDGRTSRWGPNEPDGQDIPDDLSFRTQIPGGFADLSCSLLRRIDLDYPDLGLFDEIRVYGPGNRTAWEGRMAQFPRSHGDGFAITPGAVGWSANLSDKPVFQEIYVDRDSGQWGEMPLERKAALLAASNSIGDFSYTAGQGGLVCPLPNQVLGSATLAEAWYQAPAGCLVAKVGYRGKVTSLPASWVQEFVATDTRTETAADVITSTLDDTLRSATLATARRYLVHLLSSAGVSATPAAGAGVAFSKLAVYGNHGLTTRSNGTEPDGLYASDVIEDIVTRTAPLLSIGDIQATTFVIPHLVFLDLTSGEDAIQFVNAFHGFPWGVYDNKEFFWHDWDSSEPWQARLSTGARLDLEGETAEQIFNGVYVIYQDAATGTKKTVGPPGAGADATDASLEDTSSVNPVNAWGFDRWGVLDVSQTTTQAGAVQLGAIWLAEHATPQRRGTITLTGSVTHPSEGEVPVWRVRAGDYISISDHPADVPRKIIETRYTHATRQLSANVDNTPHALDAILARFGVTLVGVL